jgi:hypothetical protein
MPIFWHAFLDLSVLARKLLGAKMFWRKNVLARKPFWRENFMARKHFGAQTL